MSRYLAFATNQQITATVTFCDQMDTSVGDDLGRQAVSFPTQMSRPRARQTAALWSACLNS